MKKLFTTLSLLTLVISSSIFVSCSSDDNSSKEVEVIQQDPLLGKWNLEKIDLKISIDGNVVQEEHGVDITNQIQMYFEFFEGNLVHLFQKDISTNEINEGSGTFTVSGSEITIVIENESQIFEYAINNGELTLTTVEEEIYQGQVFQITTTFHLF